MNDRTPVIIGVGQSVQRDVDPANAPEPLDMLAEVAGIAAADAGVGAAVWPKVDTLALISVAGWRAQNPPRLLAERLGASPRLEFTTEVSGQIGVTAANRIAEEIMRGDTRTALIAGCNNLRTIGKLQQAGLPIEWTMGGEGEPQMLGESKPGNTELEKAYGLNGPTDIYPIFENALRAKRGLSIEEHRASMGALFEPFTTVAAANPYAWFPVHRSAEELTTVVPSNRMIGFPYPKYLNAVLATDQAAAFLMTSVEAARELGVPEERWIYYRGGNGAVEEAWWASERPDFAAAPGMADSTLGALANARISIDEVGHIDFYSCFPAAVEMACEMVGVSQDDPRGFTVTGGLPYAGGPASAYTLHSLTTMADALREDAGSLGLVTGNGWYLTKHAASVWSSEPPPDDSLPATSRDEPMDHEHERTPVPVVEEASGRGTIETYTVIYGRDGAPERGIVLGRQDDGQRFIANTPTDGATIAQLTEQEGVGRTGALSRADGLNRFELD
jgi:acetyl-CoA C-acetyltransferase